jgi:hypothetical protein
VKELNKSSRSRTSLLRRDAPFPDREHYGASSSILVTFQISFEHIVTSRRSVADLLSVISFCDRQAILENLIRDYYYSSKPVDITTANNDGFEDDVTVLRSFSFITATTDPSSWEMYRLVQDANRIWLEDHYETEKFQNLFLLRLDRAFPSGNYES